MRKKILEIKDLHVSFDTYAGEIQAVRGVTFDLYEGETLAIVGESGCGKSVTAKSIMRLNPEPPARFKTGQILFGGNDIVKLSEQDMRLIRGRRIGMIFQDPMTSLNPTMTIGRQIVEGLRKHKNLSFTEAKKVAIDMLKLVQIPNAEQRFSEYPHQFSGGMRQRAMIAIALICNPELLIADEPTTALDVTIQAQILELMKDLQSKINTSIIMITHDLGVVANISQRVIVMYGGKMVEFGSKGQIFHNSRHPYTWGLLRSVPRLDLRKEESRLLSIEGTPPDLFAPPPGCPFADRCEYSMNICRKRMPEFFEISPGHASACWLNHSAAPAVTIPDYSNSVSDSSSTKGGLNL